MTIVGRCGSWALVLVVAVHGSARADYEADLLKKFQKQNQQTAQQIKADVEANLARALALSAAEPEKSQDLLRKSQDLLREDDKLAKGERDVLTRKIREHLQEVRERLRSKEEAARAQAAELAAALARSNPKLVVPDSAAARPMAVSPPQPFPVQAGFQATPVATPDRRFVRIGVSAGFLVPRMGPMIPIQTPVPNLLQGPGNGFTVGRPTISQIFLPAPAFTQIGVNTTVMAPSGGAAVVGGIGGAQLVVAPRLFILDD